MLNINKIYFSLNYLGIFFVTLFLSLSFCFFIDQDYGLSVQTGMFSLSLCAGIYCFFIFRYNHFPFLLCFVLLCFLMPFLHFFEYILNNGIIFQENIFGLASCPYTKDIEIFKRSISLGVVGVIGLTLGVLFFRALKVENNTLHSKKEIKTLGCFGFVFISFLAFLLSYIYAPQLSLFKSQYAHGINLSFFSKINFNGSWQLSYSLLIVTLLDTWNDKNKRRKLIKYGIFIINFLTIVIWLQFMRGDRECFGLVLAVGILFVYKLKISKLKIMLCGIIFVLLFFVLQYIGAARSHVHRLGRLPNFKECGFSLSVGTWSGALRSPVSVVGDFYYDSMEASNGKTMLSLFLSTIPGPVSRMFNIDRPVESTRGPAWEMRYGIGGTHCSVVPYMDFKIYGVLFFHIIYGFCFAFLESLMNRPSLSKRLLYGSIFVSLPFFVWYGELSLIRGIMAWMIVYSFYLFIAKKEIR